MEKQLELALNQEETTQATHVMTNDIDLKAAGDPKKPLWFEILVTTTFATSAGATVQFKLLTDGDAAFGSAVTLIETAAIAAASLVAGYKYRYRIPPGLERHLRGQMIVDVGALSAGAFTAFITNEVQTNE